MCRKGHILKKINNSFVLCKIQVLLKFLKHSFFSVKDLVWLVLLNKF